MIQSLIVALILIIALGGSFTGVFLMNKKTQVPDGAEADFLCESCKSTGGCKFKI
ncbi:MAG: hypothetical protein FWG67_06525 [Defluviitaleaceae bacterium]|nr:hypothetical protein [Defluviitaleaceae bacterium]